MMMTPSKLLSPKKTLLAGDNKQKYLKLTKILNIFVVYQFDTYYIDIYQYNM